MAAIITILKLFPLIVAAVQAVEAAVPVAASGKAKLDLVLGTVTDIYSAAEQTTHDMPLDRLVTLISQTIARVVATFNALGIFKKAA